MQYDDWSNPTEEELAIYKSIPFAERWRQRIIQEDEESDSSDEEDNSRDEGESVLRGIMENLGESSSQLGMCWLIGSQHWMMRKQLRRISWS